MTHEPARAVQQARRIRQRCALEEPYVYVRSEYVDVAERRISKTCNRAAVMQQLPDFVAALPHHLKPVKRDDPQFTPGLMLQALIYSELNQPAQAVPLLRKVLDLDPARQQVARYHLSLALARLGQTREAEQVMAELLRLQALERVATDSQQLTEDPARQVQAAERLLSLSVIRECRHSRAPFES